MLQRVTSTPKIAIITVRFELDIPRINKKEHSTIDSMLIHPNKDLTTHPNLERRVGFGIPVNQYWTTWTTPRTTPMLQRATSTPKIGSGTGRFELDIPQKDRNE